MADLVADGHLFAQSGASGAPLTSDIAALASGGFVRVWGSGPGNSGGAAVFDATGHQVGATIVLQHVMSTTDVIGLANGGFAIAWQSDTNTAIMTQAFDASGIAVGSATQASAGSTNAISVPKLALRPDGSYVLAWNQSPSAFNDVVVARAFDASGAALGSAVTVGAPGGGGPSIGYSPGDLGTLADGRVVIALAGLPRTMVGARILDTSNHVGDPADNGAGNFIERDAPTGASYKSPAVTILASGKILFTYLEQANTIDQNTVLHGEVLETNGASTGVTFSRAVGNGYSVTALADGDFAVAYLGTTNVKVFTQLYGSDAAAIGEAIQIDDGGQIMREAPVIGSFGGDNLAVGWSYNSGTGETSALEMLFGTTPGTTGADVLTGTANTDVLTGLDGNDTLSGLAGDDFLVGGAGADSLTGGAGSDVFVDTAANLDGDTITDLSVFDRIAISDANLAGFQFTYTAGLAGGTLAFSGTTGASGATTPISGAITFLASLPAGYHFTAASDQTGVSLKLIAGTVQNDFDGDGKSDILWRSAGQVGDWLATGGGNFAANPTLYGASSDWRIAGTGDFNGDGKSDILWRNADGRLGDWFGTAGGTFTANATLSGAGNDWQVVGTGDFNGDGRADILWRNSDGRVGTWSADANGNFSANATLYPVGNEWKVAGTGDFNGDGRADILWRNTSTGQLGDWLANADGTFTPNATLSSAPLNWHIAETGDFNGDGRTDILWRSDAGQVGDWLADANGNFTANATIASAPLDWKIVEAGDYNGDGRTDILWRNTSTGQTGDWIADANGNFTPNANLYAAPLDWTVATDHAFLV